MNDSVSSALRLFIARILLIPLMVNLRRLGAGKFELYGASEGLPGKAGIQAILGKAVQLS